MQNNDFIWLGTIANTHGLKGELKILTNSDEIDKNFTVEKLLFLEDESKLKIKSIRFHKNYLLIFFEGITSIDQAEKLKGKKFYIKREELNENQFYLIDTIGAKVINKKNNKEIGIIKSYFDQGAYDSYLITTSDNKSINIPIIDEFIDSFDKEKKIVFINYLPEEN